MKTCCTVPELSTVKENGIKDLVNIDKTPEQLRVLHLDGSFIRIKITKDYVELNSIEEIDLNGYKPVFENIQKFIYKLSEVYLFGVFNDEQIEIYDIYLNENFLSTKDMKVFGKMGLPISKPIIEGNLTFNDVMKIYEIYKTFYIFPSVYINDRREETIRTSVKTKIIFGEKKENTFWSSTNYLDQTYPKINNLSEPEIKEVEIPADKPEVYTITTKNERTQIFNEVYKNVSKHMEELELKRNEEKWDEFNTVSNQEVLDFWNKKGKEIVYLYSIYTLPKTRQLVYDYYDLYDYEEYNYQSVLDAYDMSYTFLDLLIFYHQSELSKHSIDLEDPKQETIFYIILEKELEVFLGFFISENGFENLKEIKEDKNV